MKDALRMTHDASRPTQHAARNMLCVPHFIFLACFLFFICVEPRAYSQSQSYLAAIYRQANADYGQGRYERAIEKYEQIAHSLQNGVVYYNLGNAYFRLGKRGKAILNYERAKRLMPRDKDIDFNLKITRGMNVDSSSPLKPRSGFSLLYRPLHPHEIVWIGLAFFWFATTSFVGILLSQNRRFQVALRYIAFVSGLSWLFANLLLGLKIRALNVPYAIVTANEVVLQSEPDLNAVEIADPLHEGTKIQLTAERGDWVKIYLPDDNAGWLLADAIGKI